MKICVFCKAPWGKLLHLLGRTQGGRASSLPEFLKQSGSRYVRSSTAGKGVKAPPRWTALGQPHTSPRCKEAAQAPKQRCKHLSQNGYYRVSLSLSRSLCREADDEQAALRQRQQSDHFRASHSLQRSCVDRGAIVPPHESMSRVHTKTFLSSATSWVLSAVAMSALGSHHQQVVRSVLVNSFTVAGHANRYLQLKPWF